MLNNILERDEKIVENASSPEQHTKPAKQHTVLAMALTASLAILAVAGISFAVLRLYIQNPIEFGLSDWLKAALPVVGGAIVVVFAFLGVNRLKDFDERQDRLEKELRDELARRMDKSDNTLSEVKKSADEYFKDLRQEIIAASLPKMISDGIEKKNKELQALFNKKSDAVSQLTDEFQEKYSKLMQLFSNIPGLQNVLQNKTDWNNVQTNVAWVHDFVEKQFANMSSVENVSETTVILENIRSVVDAVCSNESKISGNADDYHNLSSELARNNQLDMAVDVLKKGVVLFPHNTDLLAGILLYSTRLGDSECKIRIGESKCAVEEVLRKIPMEQWNWRAFTFYIDAINNRDRNDENMKAALSTAEEYIRILPNEERAYMAKYETLERYGRHKEAKNALEEAECTLGMTAQCSLFLCKIYKMEGAYEAAIKSATKAIISTAESQPSAAIGAAFAERAFSRDALVLRDILNNSRSREGCQEDVQLALKDYQLAEQFGYRRGAILDNRKRILKSLIQLQDDENEDAEEDKKLELYALLDMDEHKLKKLVSSLHELSPITSDNYDAYLQLFLDTAEGNEEKAKQLRILVEKIFM